MQVIEKWSRRSGLNGRPAVYETAALPTELRRPLRKVHNLHGFFLSLKGFFVHRQTTDEKIRRALPDALTDKPAVVKQWPLLEPGNGLQPDQGSLAWPREAEGLLLVAILLVRHLEHLPLGIGAEFARKDGAVLIEVCCTTQAFE